MSSFWLMVFSKKGKCYDIVSKIVVFLVKFCFLSRSNSLLFLLKLLLLPKRILLLFVHVSWEEFISTLNVSELPFAIRLSPTSCTLDVLYRTLAYSQWKVLPTVCKYPPAQALPFLLVMILIDQQDNLISLGSFWC